MTIKRPLGIACVAALVFSCGGQEIVTLGSGGAGAVCGAGTALVNGVCEADGGSDPTGGTGGAGGAADTTAPTTTTSPSAELLCAAGTEKITLSVDEPATIYYTTDGSEPTIASPAGINQVVIDVDADVELKYFAVDLAGNAEAVKSKNFVLDGTPPAAATDVTGTLNADKFDLTWTNPADADFDSVVVFSTDGGAPDEPPANCSTYQVGQTLGNATVAYVGGGTAASIAMPLGTRSFRVYPVDAVGNYATQPAAASALRVAPPGPQSGVIHVADPTGTPTATIATQPAASTLAATATINEGSLTIEIEITNGKTGIALLAPKLTMTKVNEGTAAMTAGFLSKSTPFWRVADGFGIDVDATEKITMQLDGITGNVDPIVIDVGLLYSPNIIIGRRARDDQDFFGVVDSDTNEDLGLRGSCAIGSRNNCGSNAVIVSPDNRRIYMGSMKDTAVTAFSLATGAALNVATAVPGEGDDDQSESTVRTLLGDWSRGRIWAAVSHRCKDSLRSSKAGFDLVALDPFTLEPLATINVETGASNNMATGLALSPDGSTIAVVASNFRGEGPNDSAMAYFYNADTLALLGSVDLLAENDMMEEIRRVVFTSNTTAVVSSRKNGVLYSVDLANSFALTSLSHNGPTTSANIGQLTVGPHGALWATLHRNGGFLHFPADAMSSTKLATGTFVSDFGDTDSISFTPNGLKAFVAPHSGNTVNVIDPATPNNAISNFSTQYSSIRGHYGTATPY